MAIKKSIILAGLLCFVAAVFAQEGDDMLRADHPERYVVQKGDTLWDISALFLNSPWLWPEIWYANPQINNPHLIYPGDVISLVYVGGEPRLVLDRGGDASLGPRVRATPHGDAIDAIPVSAIAPFLTGAQILDEDALEDLPYIVANEELQLIVGEHSNTYARGLDAPPGTRVVIAHPGHKFYLVDEPPPEIGAEPWKLGGGATLSRGLESAFDAVAFWDDDQLLGYEVITVAEGVVTRAGDPATVDITEAYREVQPGDVVLVSPDSGYDAQYFPHAPDDLQASARVVALTQAAFGAGQYQVIVLSQGLADGFENGQVFTLYRVGVVARDEVMHPAKDLEAMIFVPEDEFVTLPPQAIAQAMVFRTFEQLSYALIMKARRPVALYDLAVSPEREL